MARLTGKAGAVSLAGGSIGTVQDWDCEVTADTAKTTAAGDTFHHRTPTFNDIKGSFKAVFDAGASYDIHTDLVGTIVAFAFKLNTAHSNPIIQGTCVVTSAKLTSPLEEAVTIEVQFEGDGTTPTYDETPQT